MRINRLLLAIPIFACANIVYAWQDCSVIISGSSNVCPNTDEYYSLTGYPVSGTCNWSGPNSLTASYCWATLNASSPGNLSITGYYTTPYDVKCNDRKVVTVTELTKTDATLVKPTINSDFDMTANNYRTAEISTQVNLKRCGPNYVTWQYDVEYTSSGGVGPFTKPSTTATKVTDSVQKISISAAGGKVKLTPKLQQTGELLVSSPIEVTVTGSKIPNSDITARLKSLYSGVTPNLFTGVALIESSYRQFDERLNIYGRVDRWPVENFKTKNVPRGTYIGMMMVTNSMDRAWDWYTNTQYAVNFFNNDKRSIALLWERKIIKDASKHCSLRELTELERENMTLVAYGNGANNNLRGQYYWYQVPAKKDTPKNTTPICTWIENTSTKSAEGRRYTKEVRAGLK